MNILLVFIRSWIFISWVINRPIVYNQIIIASLHSSLTVAELAPDHKSKSVVQEHFKVETFKFNLVLQSTISFGNVVTQNLSIISKINFIIAIEIFYLYFARKLAIYRSRIFFICLPNSNFIIIVKDSHRLANKPAISNIINFFSVRPL